MKSTDRLKKLVADLFQLSQLEARQVTPNLERFAIAELINDLIAKYQLIASDKNISLKTNIENTNVLVNADLALIERVLSNLMDNAIKHTPNEGEVDIQLKTTGANLEVSVSNTGEGISKDDMENIFDRYFTKSKSGSEGTGLGLAIVKNILDIHDTAINVTSKIKERTTFFFQLPVM